MEISRRFYRGGAKSLLVLAFAILVLGATANSVWAASARLAVKRGQKSVDAATLPFACIRLTLAGASLPIQQIIFRDLDRQTDVTAMLAKTFGEAHPDYLTAMEGNSRSAILAVLRMKPGHYRILSVEYNPKMIGGVGTMMIDTAKQGSFEFVVEAGQVNYVGCLVIAPQWNTRQAPTITRTISSYHSESTFAVRLTIEATGEQDRKWAGDVVPAMRDLPSRIVVLTQH